MLTASTTKVMWNSKKSPMQKEIKGCIIRNHFCKKIMQQKMANLPILKLTETFPFQYISIDMAGPFPKKYTTINKWKS
jgi:hypothetical protein